MPAIVVVNESVQLAPAPNTLQQSGALLTQGGTNTPVGTLTLVSSLAQVLALLSPEIAIATIVWASGGGGTVTVTTATPHGWANGATPAVLISGVLPAGYNGQFAITVTGASTFTYPLASNPGAETQLGDAQLLAASELTAMATTAFDQFNGAQSFYVLELGVGANGTVANGITELTSWIAANPGMIYIYTVPRLWDGNSGFLTFAQGFDGASGLTYFAVTTTLANRAFYTGTKSVLAQVEAPSVYTGAAAYTTEFSIAADFASILAYAPSSAQQVPPLCYSPVSGVTPYPTPGNASVFTQLDAANVSWIETGAEGGLSNTIIHGGNCADGNPFNFWYAGDWVQLNIKLNLANEVINGSATSINPLYYDQQGIDRLQNRAYQTLGVAISSGLGNGTLKKTKLPTQTFQNNYNAGLYIGQIVINADPFQDYVNNNPSDFPVGIYRGLTCVFTPNRGFKQIIFQLLVTELNA